MSNTKTEWNECRPTTNAALGNRPCCQNEEPPLQDTDIRKWTMPPWCPKSDIPVCLRPSFFFFYRTLRWMKIWLRRRQRRHWGAAFIWESWTWVTTCCMSTASAAKPGPISSMSVDSSINPSRAVDFEKNSILQFPCQPQEGRLVSFGIPSPFVIYQLMVEALKRFKMFWLLQLTCLYGPPGLSCF